MNNDDLPDFSPLDSSHEQGLVTRYDVVKEARSWIDTNYVHQHRTKGHGVDCAGLVIGVARELGLVAPDFDVTGYERSPDGVSLLAVCDQFMTRIPMWTLKPGHVLVLSFGKKSGGKPQHMGIVGDYMYHGELTLIQALGTSDGKGRVIESRLIRRKDWKPVQAYALPGVEA